MYILGRAISANPISIELEFEDEEVRIYGINRLV